MPPINGNSQKTNGANTASTRLTGKPEVAVVPHKHTTDCRESGRCEFDRKIESLKSRGMS